MNGREDHKNIYFEDKPISAGLHLTLIQCFEPSIFNKQTIQKCLDTLNHNLKGKFIKIAAKNGVADLEFGMSGQSWRIRSGQKIEFKKSNPTYMPGTMHNCRCHAENVPGYIIVDDPIYTHPE